MAQKTPWEFEAEYIQSCNCDYGCPCNFNGLPTHGNCEALLAYRIRKGKFASTALDGVTFAQALWWPSAIHLGNGTARLYVDPGASPAQRAAIEAIVGGQHGGGVFEIFPRTWTKVHPTRVAKIDFHFAPYDAGFKVDGVGEVHSEHIRNARTGKPFEGKVLLPNGIAWKEGIVTSIKRWWMRDEDLLAYHTDRAGFTSVVKFTQAGCVG